VSTERIELKSVKQRIAISIIPFTLRAGAPIYKIGLFIEGIGLWEVKSTCDISGYGKL
jgi:hypothetical protein